MMSLKDKTMALLVAGRNATHGYHVETEIMGTKGMLRVAQVPEKNLVTIMNNQGLCDLALKTFQKDLEKHSFEKHKNLFPVFKKNVNQQLMQKMVYNQQKLH